LFATTADRRKGQFIETYAFTNDRAIKKKEVNDFVNDLFE